jgi:hypothetical protein
MGLEEVEVVDDFPGGRVGMDIYYRALDRVRIGLVEDEPVMTSDAPEDVLNYLTSLADDFTVAPSAREHLRPGDRYAPILRELMGKTSYGRYEDTPDSVDDEIVGLVQSPDNDVAQVTVQRGRPVIRFKIGLWQRAAAAGVDLSGAESFCVAGTIAVDGAVTIHHLGPGHGVN